MGAVKIASCHPERPVFARTLCQRCYAAERRSLNPKPIRTRNRIGQPLSGPIAERIEELTDRTGGPDACHLWTGLVYNSKAHFICRLAEGRVTTISPRRFLFEALHGKLKPREKVRMKCGNVLCMNVAHMFGGFENYFRTFVDRSGGPDACWPWTGMKLKGYGRFGTGNGIRFFAHRVAYELEYGPIEGHVHHDRNKEIVVMHTCDNPPCCNPKHLRIGTDRDNIRDAIAKGRMHWQQRTAPAPVLSESK